MKKDNRRYKIVVTDLREGKTCMDVTTSAAMISITSAFNNLKNEDEKGYSHGMNFFECCAGDIVNCITTTLQGISKLVASHSELGSLLELFLMSMLKEEEDKNE